MRTPLSRSWNHFALVACSFSALWASNLCAQTTATTDPVGFITLNIAGTGGTSASALSFKGLGLTRAVEYQGSAESIGTNTLTDSDATWTDNQFNGTGNACYVEITSGTAAGTTYDIASTTASTKTITLSQNLAAGVSAGATFKIRKHWTFASAFGTSNPPESGLQAGNSSSADQVLIYNGSTYDTYFYSSGGLLGTGWRKSGSGNTDQGPTKIFPDTGLIIMRQQSSNVSMVLTGTVKTGQSSSPVFTGLNFVGNVYASNMTLGSSGLYTGNSSTGVASGNSSSADQVLVYNGSTYDTYFYSSGGLLGTGWRKSGTGSTDQSPASIPAGSSIIIDRKGSAFNWVAPQHPASL